MPVYLQCTYCGISNVLRWSLFVHLCYLLFFKIYIAIEDTIIFLIWLVLNAITMDWITIGLITKGFRGGKFSLIEKVTGFFTESDARTSG